MVRAILAGSKTMTRRVIKNVPENISADLLEIMVNGCHRDHGHIEPFCKKGDILWVRENFLKIPTGCKTKPVAIAFPDQCTDEVMKRLPLRPSIHLPKADARIWLQVSELRVERLIDITEEDAKAEGVLLHERGIKWLHYGDREAKVTQAIFNLSSARASFKSLWNLIHGNHTHDHKPWNANPWVWVISFNVLSTKGRPANVNTEGAMV
jgi:hypothetical protein